MSNYIVPVILLISSTLVLYKKESSYDLLLTGGAEGLQMLKSIAPALVMLLVAVTALRQSGAVDWISKALSPAFGFLGIPPETALLVLVRPLSGSAALAVGAEIMAQYGADSLIGRTAAVMLGSTETTFYTIAVYFGATGIKHTRHAVPAALCADLSGFIAAALAVRLFFG